MLTVTAFIVKGIRLLWSFTVAASCWYLSVTVKLGDEIIVIVEERIITVLVAIVVVGLLIFAILILAVPLYQTTAISLLYHADAVMTVISVDSICRL